VKSTINILSDHVINQIAAGEVIKRPSSIVKELLENSIDAQSKNIQIIIENAGKKLIQIIDDGQGMNKQDAEICFNKHATSKIQSIEDIGNILTMGFRGEALASIASISEVELKTKTIDEELGTMINIDNSIIKKNNPTSINKGTSISVKNLFFNIPARKKFLKSDSIEMKNILETFMQIAISKHDIGFKLTHNKKNIYDLSPTNLKQRIIQLFGKKYNQKILPIKENTSIVNIYGFLGNPLDAKKTRGEQFIYVNNRFIKSAYLNHAIKKSMDNMIMKEHYPSYFIFLIIEPQLIDINVHPNKTEVKFEDEKAIYQILKSTCKKSIGMYNITPSLDFSVEESFEIPVHIQRSLPKEPQVKINTNFNPFQGNEFREKESVHKLFVETDISFVKEIINIDEYYAACILNNSNSISLIDKKRAIERIVYEDTKQKLKDKKILKQFIIKPYKIRLNQMDIQIVKENKEIIESLGYNIDEILSDSIQITAIPDNIKNSDKQIMMESFIEELKLGNSNIHEDLINKLSKKFTHNVTSKKSNYNTSERTSLESMINKLLKCQNPFLGIDGKPCMVNLEPNQIFH